MCDLKKAAKPQPAHLQNEEIKQDKWGDSGAAMVIRRTNGKKPPGLRAHCAGPRHCPVSVFEGRLGSCAEHVFALTPCVCGACLPLSISNRISVYLKEISMDSTMLNVDYFPSR